MMVPFLRDRLAVAVSTALVSSLSSTVVLAQDDEAGFIEEVVVTAQKREQNLQDVPVAITAIDAQQLDDRSIKDIADVGTSAPNVQIAPSPGGSTGATIAIRGATAVNPAATWEPSVGLYMDGVFIAKNVGGIFDVAELERIEILRGPQGTLFGKNTTGGALSLYTRKPAEEMGGKVKVAAGNYNYTEFGLTFDTGRISDMLSVMISYSKRDRDGFYDNENSGIPGAAPLQIDEFKKLDSEALRISALLDISDTVELQYTYDMAERDNTVAFGQFEPGVLKGGKFVAAKVDRADEGSLDGAGEDTSDNSGHTLNIAWDINDDLLFKSITAYRELSFADQNDYDGSAFLGFNTKRDVDQDQSSQEFQLVGVSGDWNYVLGAYYFDESVDVENPFFINIGAPAAAVVRNFYGADSTSYALFGQADWAVNDSIGLSFGLRWTQEEKEAFVDHPDAGATFSLAPFSSKADESWDNVSPTVVLNYYVNDDITTYAKVSQGWKAGGFNAEAATKEIAETPYDEEILTAYELGLKSQLADGRVQANIAIFQNDVKDVQISSFDPTTFYSKVENAGKSVVQGLELETIVAITDSFTAFFNYSYLDADYKDFVDPVSGAQLKDTATFAYAPENKAALGLEYVDNVGFAELRARFDYSYTDEQFFYRDEPGALVTQSEEYAILNGRIALADIAVGQNNSLEVGIWGKNLTDEEYRLNGIPQINPDPFFRYSVSYYGDPRTFGADVSYSF
ncbi:MAG: TonB-dependent receptor [Pseudomonadales bacterium]|nr:TonB-dependent receptor [Pseudomonadales bacterium]